MQHYRKIMNNNSNNNKCINLSTDCPSVYEFEI